MRGECDFPACVDGYLARVVIDPYRLVTRKVWTRCPQCLGTGVFDEVEAERRTLGDVDPEHTDRLADDPAPDG